MNELIIHINIKWDAQNINHIQNSNQFVFNMDLNKEQKQKVLRILDQPPLQKDQSKMLRRSLNEAKEQVKLTFGDDFEEMVRAKNTVFVDKTMAIQRIWKTGGRSYMFLRPSKFGKSTFLSMINLFFKKQLDQQGQIAESKRKLFKNTYIWQDKKFIDEYQGVYSVIFMTWKNIKPKTEEDFLKQFAEEIKKLIIKQFYYLKKFIRQEMGRHREYFIEKFFTNKQINKHDILHALQNLVYYLYEFQRRERKVVFLIDDFDSPVSYMVFNQCPEEERKNVQEDILRMLQTILKGNNHIQLAILTGVYNTFSDLYSINTIRIFNLYNSQFSTLFGFSQNEIKGMIDQIEKQRPEKTKQSDNEGRNSFDEEEMMNNITDWYQGYRVEYRKKKKYNPFSVSNYLNQCVQTQSLDPKQFWMQSASDNLFSQILSALNQYLLQKVELLLYKPKQSRYFRSSEWIKFAQLGLFKPIKEEYVAKLLYHSGYVTGKITDDELMAVVPNFEMEKKLLNIFIPWFTSHLVVQKKVAPEKEEKWKKVSIEDPKQVEGAVLQEINRRKHKFGQQQETFCRGIFIYVLGINDRHQLSPQLHSNGVVDQIFLPRHIVTTAPAIVHKCQYVQNPTEESLKNIVISTLWQIYEKNYLNPIISQSPPSVIVRSIVIVNNQMLAQPMCLAFSRDQIHPLEEAQKIIKIFKKNKKKDMKKAEERFRSIYQSQPESNKVILKFLQQWEKEVEWEEKDQNQNIFVLPIEDDIYVSKTPENFSYGLVGRSIKGRIGQDWRPMNDDRTANFKFKFRDGPTLYHITADQIMTIDGFSREQAEKIVESIEKMKLNSNYFDIMPKKKVDK